VEADASGIILAAQSADIAIGGDFTITDGNATVNGANAIAMAIAGTEIGTQITGTEILTVAARSIFINSGKGNVNLLTGGAAAGFGSLVSSGAIRITVTGQNLGEGLVLDGAGGTGLFDALGPTLIRVTGTGYPISVTGRIEVKSPAALAPRHDALVVAGAPLIDESLLAAFLRATESARQETFAQDVNLQQRGSKGPAGVCR